MRKTGLLVLVAATVAAVAAASHALMRDDRTVGLTPSGRPAIPGLAAHLGDLAWLRLVHGGATLDFGSIDGVWTVVEKDNYPAAQDRVRGLLRGLADLVLVAPKTRRPALFARLGLGDPRRAGSTLVTAQDRTGATVAALITGKRRSDPTDGGDDGVYIRRPGDDQTWLARGALAVPGDDIDWLDRRILDIPPSRIAAVTLTGVDGAALRLRRDAPPAPFAIANAPPGSIVKDAAALAAPAGALARLDLDDVQPAADLPVPARGVATAVFATFDGLTVKLRLFTRDRRDWLILDAAGNGAAAKDAAGLNARLARWVYAVPAERARLLRTRLADLVAKGS
jgi:hypothetical protein